MDLPKVILHEHIEGSVTPKMAQILAKQQGVALPSGFLYEAGEYDILDFPQGRYKYDESNFNEFIYAYDVVANLIKSPDDYYLITKDYLSRNAAQGMIYCEIITSAYHLCFDEKADCFDGDKYNLLMCGIEKAINEVKAETGLETYLHACGVRHLDFKSMLASAQFVKENPRSSVVGFNIAGNEMAGKFSDFNELHSVVADIPLPKSYHAGEICGPESMLDALACGAARIGHGIACIEDEQLIAKLINDNILLEIAPTSNRILVPKLKQEMLNHPIRKIYDAGVRLSINTDDAGLFGTDVLKEYSVAMNTFNFTRIELLDVTLCALEGAFVNESIKSRLINDVYKTFKNEDWQALENLNESKITPALGQRYSQRLTQRKR